MTLKRKTLMRMTLMRKPLMEKTLMGKKSRILEAKKMAIQVWRKVILNRI